MFVKNALVLVNHITWYFEQNQHLVKVNSHYCDISRMTWGPRRMESTISWAHLLRPWLADTICTTSTFSAILTSVIAIILLVKLLSIVSAHIFSTSIAPPFTFSFLVIFMSLWFAAYSRKIFVSFLRSNPMSCVSQFPLWLRQQKCLTHRKYSGNSLSLISPEQNNSPRSNQSVISPVLYKHKLSNIDARYLSLLNKGTLK